jgi:hypothetical protein
VDILQNILETIHIIVNNVGTFADVKTNSLLFLLTFSDGIYNQLFVVCIRITNAWAVERRIESIDTMRKVNFSFF